MGIATKATIGDRDRMAPQRPSSSTTVIRWALLEMASPNPIRVARWIAIITSLRLKGRWSPRLRPLVERVWCACRIWAESQRMSTGGEYLVLSLLMCYHSPIIQSSNLNVSTNSEKIVDVHEYVSTILKNFRTKFEIHIATHKR